MLIDTFRNIFDDDDMLEQIVPKFDEMAMTFNKVIEKSTSHELLEVMRDLIMI